MTVTQTVTKTERFRTYDSSTAWDNSYITKYTLPPFKRTTKPDLWGWRAPTPYRRCELFLGPIMGTKIVYESMYDLTRVRRYRGNVRMGDRTEHVRPSFIRAFNDTDQALLPYAGQNQINMVNVLTLLKLKQQNVNYGVAIAEGRKTINHLATTLMSVCNAYRAVRRGDLPGLRKALGVKHKQWKTKAPASRWLEVQYGWLPLLSDIHGTYETLSKPTPPMVFYAKQKVRVLEEETVKYHQNDSTGLTSSTNTSQWSGYVDVTLRLDAEVISPLHIATMMGLSNPAEIAWELVPFSFVLDWAFPVGNFLSALDATLGLRFKAGTRTTYRRSVCGTVVTPPVVVTTHPSITAEGGALYRAWQRETLTSFPFPLPYVKNPLKTKRAITAAALLRQLKR